jgi:hypothetical protein
MRPVDPLTQQVIVKIWHGSETGSTAIVRFERCGARIVKPRRKAL